MKTKTQDGRPFSLSFENGQRRNAVEVVLDAEEQYVFILETISLSDAIRLRYELDAVIRAANYVK